MRILIAVAFSAYVLLQPAPQDEAARLQDELNQTLRELHELRQGYYKNRQQRQREIDEARSARDRLAEDTAELADEVARLDKELAAIRTEHSGLEKRRTTQTAELAKIRAAVDRFVEQAHSHVDRSLPYRVIQRRKAVESIPDGLSSESVGRTWAFFQDELRIARSGETYTDEVELPDGRRKHARLLRVGKHVLAFVTEDALDVGLWIEGEGWVTDPARIDADAIRAAVEILDRRRAPEWVSLKFRAPGKEPK